MVRGVVSRESLESVKSDLDLIRDTIRRACGRAARDEGIARFINRELAPLVLLAFQDSSDFEARAVGAALRRALSPRTRERAPT